MGLHFHALELSGPAGDTHSRLHQLDPRAKIVGVLCVTLVAVSTPLSLWPVFLACAAVLAGIAAAGRVGPGALWRRSAPVLPVVGATVILLPFVRTGGTSFNLGPLVVHEAGLATAATLATKALLGVLGAVLLCATTTFPDLLRGLEALRLPRPLVLITAFMYRYLFVILEELASMRAALAARGFRPRTALQAAAVGRVGGSLFLRSYGRGERVYQAMLARGYSGHMPQLRPLTFGRADAYFVALVLAAVLPLRLAAGLSA